MPQFPNWPRTIILILMLLFISCVSDPEPEIIIIEAPEPVCNTVVSDICNKSNYDGSEVCGYPSMSSCMNKTTVFGFTCYEVLNEVCY